MKNIVGKNLSLISNLVANILGVLIINHVQGDITQRLMPAIRKQTELLISYYDPFIFSICLIAVIIYEKPIRQCFNYTKVTDAPEPLLAQARKRLLTIPYFFMGLNLFAWLLAAVLFPIVLSNDGAPKVLVVRIGVQCIIIGVTICTLAFFLVEAVLQSYYMKRFFPQGGVFTIKGIPHTRIIIRLLALFIITGFIPSVVSLVMTGGMERMLTSTPLSSLEIINLYSAQFKTNAFIFIIVGILLALLVSFTLVRPLGVVLEALHDIRRGKFDVKIPVSSTDEIGYTCETINNMAHGLLEKERLKESLNLAGVVQKSLLPKDSPKSKQLDIATTSIPCDETGGDYFDFIRCDGKKSTLSIVVGDVAGHGIASALLMTSVRAMIRTRCAIGGSDTEIIGDVNKLLCQDVGESGNFVTLFLLSYEEQSDTISWVRAGHDPALLYDQKTDTFIELREGGMSLGVLEEAAFSSSTRTVSKGDIILLGTDGIWETPSENNELFGKERVRKLIRENANHDAQLILDKLISTLTSFRGGRQVEDDITAIVLKVI